MGCFVGVDPKWLSVFCLSWGVAACAAPERRTGPVSPGGEVRSLDDAARLAVMASIADDTALAALRRASLTGAQIRAMCPGARRPDQVEPALVNRYIRAQCPRATDKGCGTAHLDDTGAFTFETVDPAWWGGQGCFDLSVWRIVVPSIECARSHGCDADFASGHRMCNHLVMRAVGHDKRVGRLGGRRRHRGSVKAVQTFVGAGVGDGEAVFQAPHEGKGGREGAEVHRRRSR